MFQEIWKGGKSGCVKNGVRGGKKKIDGVVIIV